MPPLLLALLGGLVEIAGSLAGRVLLSLGFTALTYTGVAVTLTWLKTQALSALGGVSAQALSLMGYMGVGEFISIVFSALVVRLTLNGLSAGGSISKLVKGG